MKKFRESQATLIEKLLEVTLHRGDFVLTVDNSVRGAPLFAALKEV